jgi:NAD(P)-dependent dehydrogenase (short-subunit alcohol dehydrogenase family)
MQLTDKVALITGGTSGIGRATAELFAAEGARVAITGRRAKLGRQVADATGGIYLQADHRRQQDCEAVVSAALEAFGRIDILFNNAGIVVSGTAEGTSEQDWEDTLLLNDCCLAYVAWSFPSCVPRAAVSLSTTPDWALVGAPSVAYCTPRVPWCR